MTAPEQRFSIGRASGCDIVVPDPSVSRHHAELVVLPDGKLFLIDRRSSRGTAILRGGQRIAVTQEVISPTDVLCFG
ncbi:MAG: FHA domain-containing protein, partial [Gemmatimonadetes bacterium]